MSGLNCRPGDLAMVVCGIPRENVGRVIRCIKTDGFTTAVCGLLMWDYEGDLVGPFGGRSILVSDDCLKPIRDPGDDAVDEMVKLVGIAPMTAAEVLAWSAA